MKRIEQTPVFIESLYCSDEFHTRLQKPHVSRLADSIKAHGLIHPPVVRASDMQVIAGEDRIAAHHLLGLDEVLVDLVECSDEEVTALREEENDKRRSPAEVKAMVDGLAASYIGGDATPLESTPHSVPGHEDLVEEVESWLDPSQTDPQEGVDTRFDNGWLGPSTEPHSAIVGEPPKRPRGRPKGQKSKAIEETAKKLGVTPNAVRKKIARVEPEGDAPPWNDWGREKPEIQEKAAAAYRLINRARSQVLSAMKSVTIAGKALAISDADTTETWEALKKTGERLASLRPTMLCGWCKGQPKVMKGCAACNGMGYLAEGVAVPKDLQNAGVVMVFGRKTVDDDLGI